MLKKASVDRILLSQDIHNDVLDEKGFPKSLKHFKIEEFHNELQTFLSMNDLKKYYECSTENVDNLAMMNCRPSALSYAEKMTNDLYRLFQ